MTNFRAELELHSVNPVGDEAITFVHTAERMVHSEFMTHRVSRNASSSRAIPWERMKAWIDRDPAMPLHFGRNQPGMQSGAEIDDVEGARQEILDLYKHCRNVGDRLVNKYGLHKEIVNRFVEPWGWINVVSTWSRPAFMNYVALRCTPYAEPRIQRMAISMLRLYKQSVPQKLEAGDWHIPFIKDFYQSNIPINTAFITKGDIDKLLVWSVARSAWVSYQTVEERVATWDMALKRATDCVNLKHVTPCEHQKRANEDHSRNGGTTPGFDEYRHMIPDESVNDVDIDAILALYEGKDFLIA